MNELTRHIQNIKEALRNIKEACASNDIETIMQELDEMQDIIEKFTDDCK